MRGIMVKSKKMLEDFGVMTEPWSEELPRYNIRKLDEYCKRVGKKAAELTDEEREQFRTN